MPLVVLYQRSAVHAYRLDLLVHGADQQTAYFTVGPVTLASVVLGVAVGACTGTLLRRSWPAVVAATALNKAIDVAAAHHPAAVNNSWGMSEFSEESYYDRHCKLADSVCTQSTGDYGYPAGYSSTNPYALAIGGTNLVLGDDGSTTSESAWTSTGGGLSYFEPRPAYQDGVNTSASRGAPDVSFVADPRTGVAVYTTATGTPRWMEVGGTSLSAPIWAGIMAATDQLRADAGKQPLAVAGPDGDSVHRSVYALGDALRDITSGSNGACGTECTAGPGYDTVTGLGSPNPGVDRALAAKP